MKPTSILMPLFNTIDKILFGIDDFNEIEKEQEIIPSENEEEFDVERSNNYELLIKD
jgi:hypothetical protein